MKTGFFIIALLVSVVNLYGQDKKELSLSVSGGFLNSPYYKRARAKGFCGFEADYYLKKRHLLSVSYFAGKHTYYEDVLSNAPSAYSGIDNNNADIVYHTFSVAYKYKVVDNRLMSLTPGLGAGILTDTQTYPYAEGTIRSYPKQLTVSDLVFPVTLDFLIKLSRNWQAGIKGGLLIHPDYPILALHAGPAVAYLFQ